MGRRARCWSVFQLLATAQVLKRSSHCARSSSEKWLGSDTAWSLHVGRLLRCFHLVQAWSDVTVVEKDISQWLIVFVAFVTQLVGLRCCRFPELFDLLKDGWGTVWVWTERWCWLTVSTAAGNRRSYRLRARAGPKLVEGLISLSTGIVPGAKILVDRALDVSLIVEFSPHSVWWAS